MVGHHGLQYKRILHFENQTWKGQSMLEERLHLNSHGEWALFECLDLAA